jgi:quinol monooxygenase YgiN
MADQKISVIATMKAKQGAEEKIKKQLMSLIAPARSEKGCISYILHQSIEDKTVFMFYENWTSKKDLDEHLRMPYIKSFIEKAGGLLDEPVKISLWEMIG